MNSIRYLHELPARRIPVLAVGLITLLMPPGLNAALIHRYELDGGYADALGGPALVPGGVNGPGTLRATDYSFGPGQGLSLRNALPSAGTYSILLDFSFSNLTAYRKIVDFVNLTGDSGLYNFESALTFYPDAPGIPDTFEADFLVRLVITREASTSEFAGYVDGVQLISFVDSAGRSLFNGPNNVMQFFNDDTEVPGEHSGGVVDRIEIYDAALSSAQVAALGGPGVPEPNTLMLASIGLAALIGARQRAQCRQSGA